MPYTDNRSILEKADLALADLTAGGGVLKEAQAKKFMRLLIKESVNQTTDTMGFTNALNSCFSMHQLNHSHYATLTNGEFWVGQPEHGVLSWREAPPVATAEKDEPGVIPPRVEA